MVSVHLRSLICTRRLGLRSTLRSNFSEVCSVATEIIKQRLNRNLVMRIVLVRENSGGKPLTMNSSGLGVVLCKVLLVSSG